VKNHEGIERSHIHCVPISIQWKSAKHSLLDETESALGAWFMQVNASNDLADGSIIQEKVVHIAAPIGPEE
jgi:hypothetical protein